MNRSATCFLASVAFGAAVLTGPTGAAASDYRRSGLLGGMSAAEVMGGSAYGYGYGYYPGYAASAHYAPLDGPPPGCVIRRQRMWDGYGWRWQKLRICH